MITLYSSDSIRGIFIVVLALFETNFIKESKEKNEACWKTLSKL